MNPRRIVDFNLYDVAVTDIDISSVNSESVCTVKSVHLGSPPAVCDEPVFCEETGRRSIEPSIHELDPLSVTAAVKSVSTQISSICTDKAMEVPESKIRKTGAVIASATAIDISDKSKCIVPRIRPGDARSLPVKYSFHSWGEASDEFKKDALRTLVHTHKLNPKGLTVLGCIYRCPLDAALRIVVNEKEWTLDLLPTKQGKIDRKPHQAVIVKTQSGKTVLARL
ncbi:hypothetical protein J7K50_08195 [bacterium]|nr:hypothetical protein [bacterium]